MDSRKLDRICHNVGIVGDNVNIQEFIDILQQTVDNDTIISYKSLRNLIIECNDLSLYRLTGVSAHNKQGDPINMMELYLKGNDSHCADFNLWLGFINKDECIIVSLFCLGYNSYNMRSGYLIVNNEYEYKLEGL